MSTNRTPLCIAIAVTVLGAWAGRPAHSQDDSPSRPETKAEPRFEPDRNSGYALVLTPARQVQAELTVHIVAPRLSAREWVVYGPELPVLSSQTGVSSTLEPGGEPGRELSPEHRRILRARIPADTPQRQESLDLRAEYRATLWSRRLVQVRPEKRAGIATPSPLDAGERRAALSQGPQFDFTSDPFRRWLDQHDLRAGAEEGEIDFARRVFLAIKNGFTYAREPRSDRQASQVCRAGASDCGGLSVVFVSALRARGIPARALVGRWAQSSAAEADGKVFDQQHVKAEFYAQGVGWVPADVTSGVLHDRSPEGLAFFGDDAGDFLVLHVGTNLVCDTAVLGRRTVPWMQSPARWAAGGGTFDQAVTRESWIVKTGPPSDLVEAALNRSASPAARPKQRRPASPAPRR